MHCTAHHVIHQHHPLLHGVDIIVAVEQNCPTRSRMVSHRVLKVARLDSCPRCCTGAP